MTSRHLTTLAVAAALALVASPALAGGTAVVLYDDIDNSYHPRSTSKNCVKNGSVYEDELCVSASSGGSDSHGDGDGHEGSGGDSGDDGHEGGDGHGDGHGESEGHGDSGGEDHGESEGHH